MVHSRVLGVAAFYGERRVVRHVNWPPGFSGENRLPFGRGFSIAIIATPRQRKQRVSATSRGASPITEITAKRMVALRSAKPTKEGAMPTIVDLNAEAAQLRMFRGRTPRTTFAERKGSAVQLGRYRDGFLLLSKSAGKSHWETHPADELVHVLEGTLTLDIVEQGKPQSFALGAGMLVVVPRGAWHRVHSADGATMFSATIPGDHIDLDVDDPRAVERQPA
jgi:mannose-6-phosphate isomerase-like protein (cupin superfamily)